MMQGAIKPVKRLGSLRFHPVRSVSTILKVKNFINRPDSWPLRTISRKLNVPLTNIRRIMQQDLRGKVRSKRKTHRLSDKMVVQRLQKSHRLLEHLIHNIWRNVVSIDEAWCYMSPVNGRRKVFYVFCGPCAGNGRKCLLIFVLKRFLPENPVWNLWFRVMAFRLNTWNDFLNLFCRVKKTE